MQLLQHNRRAAALSCGNAIAAVAANGAATTPDAYGLADIQEKIEMLARAAEALGDADAATAYREMIQRPGKISDADWSYFMEARGTRIRQLDRRPREIDCRISSTTRARHSRSAGVAGALFDMGTPHRAMPMVRSNGALSACSSAAPWRCVWKTPAG
jgi:hypothetical protein